MRHSALLQCGDYQVLSRKICRLPTTVIEYSIRIMMARVWVIYSPARYKVHNTPVERTTVDSNGVGLTKGLIHRNYSNSKPNDYAHP